MRGWQANIKRTCAQPVILGLCPKLKYPPLCGGIFICRSTNRADFSVRTLSRCRPTRWGLTEFAVYGEKDEIIFCRGVYVAKNTSQRTNVCASRMRCSALYLCENAVFAQLFYCPVMARMTSNSCPFRVFIMERPSSMSMAIISLLRSMTTLLVPPSARTRTAS